MLHECIIIAYLYNKVWMRSEGNIFVYTSREWIRWKEVYFLYKCELLKYKTVKAPNGR